MGNQLPEEFRKYFWDVKFEEVDAVSSWRFVIHRLLSKGNIKATKWVANNYQLDQIQEVLRSNQDFSLRDGSFWGLIFGVPVSQLRCFNEPFRSLRMTHWPY